MTTPGIGLLEYNHLSSITSSLPRYATVIGTQGDVPTLVSSAVQGKALVYMAACDVSVNTSINYGVTYNQGLAGGWLLTNSSGNYLHNSSYPDYIGNVGAVGYQNTWISNVVAYLGAHSGLDGVFVDDCLYDLKAIAGEYCPLYPNTAAWSAAMVAFCNAVCAGVQAHGYYMCLNAGAYKSGDTTYTDGTSTVNWFNRLGPAADALMNEYYCEGNASLSPRRTGAEWYNNWDGWQRVIPAAQSHGADFVGLMKGVVGSTATAANETYGKASFLMEWNGGGGVFIYTIPSGDPTNAAWTTDIGTPVSAKVKVGAGWARSYTGGTALINPSPSVSQTFTVAGTNYTLAPGTARILVATGGITSSGTPTAGFSLSPISGTVPLAVQFTDLSSPGPSGPITGRLWNFGDGTTSTAVNPAHTYLHVGVYTATLRVTGTGADGTTSISHTVTVTAVGAVAPTPPVASFTATPTSGLVPLSVSFTGTSMPGGSGPITGQLWDFGDGTTSTNPNPSHSFTTAGPHTVILTVTGTSPDGSDSASQTITATVAPDTPGGDGGGGTGGGPIGDHLFMGTITSKTRT